jgi:hypothetical protein
VLGISLALLAHYVWLLRFQRRPVAIVALASAAACGSVWLFGLAAGTGATFVAWSLLAIVLGRNRSARLLLAYVLPAPHSRRLLRDGAGDDDDRGARVGTTKARRKRRYKIFSFVKTKECFVALRNLRDFGFRPFARTLMAPATIRAFAAD